MDNYQKRAWYQVKPGLVDQASPFDFKLVSLKSVGYIFILTAIIGPFLINILLNYLFDHTATANLGALILSWIISGVGSYFVFSRTNDKMFRSGAIAFYLFYFVPAIVSLIFSLIIGSFLANLATEVKGLINIIVGMIGNGIAIGLTYYFCPQLFKKIKLTFKKDYLRVLIIVPIAIIAAFALNYLFGFIQGLITGGTSNNQESLVNGVDKWWYALALAIYTILLAPVIEEFACRHGIFSLVGDRWVALACSTIYFAGMHVSTSGDWEHIIGYLGGALALGSLFMITWGNVTYTILTHAGMNLISFILIVNHIN
ncbi:CPBP family intramembrane glutamic endopeptidase [Spiroplasma chrysopicola]|uniref:CAAX amino terminal membrane bound protease n=1 Tax=Spiroplasma chrysopicola DF-1 TaxID=1276227 RepID=R4U317_9MOLU|nr:type II CAAX endopeptidase family protein [Spiroplasma chrysopicola]AGM24883.1 CAAX amino terminal membrane bound protease [Spiroplasma chrysopicola DF-1]